jgi:hypothetical protein
MTDKAISPLRQRMSCAIALAATSVLRDQFPPRLTLSASITVICFTRPHYLRDVRL